MLICTDCLKNVHIQRRVPVTENVDICSLCNELHNRFCTVEWLADLLANVIRQRFVSGVSVSHVLTANGSQVNLTPEPYGLPLRSVLTSMLEQTPPFLDELVDAVLCTESSTVPSEAFFGPDKLYISQIKQDSVDYFGVHWNYLVDELKHQRRFFSANIRDFFDGLFKDIEKLKTWGEDGTSLLPVVRDMAAGMPIFRARTIHTDQLQAVIKDPYREIGPPPRHKARSGRMSPEGVVALYCAMEEKTALAELRPAIGGLSVVISLKFTRTLRLLDFERLERSLDDGWGALLDSDFDSIASTRQFLRKLHNLISQPVVPGQEADYLITQTMSEYLSKILKPRLDGIMFKSVQHKDGVNVVLFRDEPHGNSEEDFFSSRVYG